VYERHTEPIFIFTKTASFRQAYAYASLEKRCRLMPIHTFTDASERPVTQTRRLNAEL